MIGINEVLPFNTKCGTGFESYMFVTSDKFMQRHNSFNDMEIILMRNGKKKTHNGNLVQTIEERKKILTLFNRILKDGNIDILKDAKKLSMELIYFGLKSEDGKDNGSNWIEEYKEIKNLILNYSKEYNRIVAISTHFHQKENINHDTISPPHIHIIYDSDKNIISLDDYLYQKLEE